MKTLLAVVPIFALLCAPQAFAGHIEGNATGTLTSQRLGACDVGYSTYCPSGNCICKTFSGTVVGTPVGRGSIVLSLTVDYGATLSSRPTCAPLFGIMEINASNASQVINAVGSSCDPLVGTVVTFSGGFGVISGGSGWGSLSGTFDRASGTGVMRYNGAY